MTGIGQIILLVLAAAEMNWGGAMFETNENFAITVRWLVALVKGILFPESSPYMSGREYRWGCLKEIPTALKCFLFDR